MPDRQARAFRHHRPEEFVRHRLRQGRGLERAHEIRIDRVGHRGHVIDQLLQLGIVAQRLEGADQHQPRDPLRKVDGEALRHQRAHRVAGDDGPRDAAQLHEVREIGRQVARMIAAVRLVGIAEAALRQRDRADRARQVGQHRLVRQPRVRESRAAGSGASPPPAPVRHSAGSPHWAAEWLAQSASELLSKLQVARITLCRGSARSPPSARRR